MNNSGQEFYSWQELSMTVES